MSYDTPKLTDEQTLTTARSVLEDHLALEANGYSCQSRMLFDVLLGACASGQTIEATCRDLEATPSAETLRHYLRMGLSLERLPAVQDQVNQALAALLPSRLRRKAHEVAVDFHDRAYYGKQQQDEALWVRARAKDGTTRFFRIATAYVIHKGMRLTLAVHFVRPEESTVEILQALLARLALLELEIGCLLLDKGFSGIAVLEYLAHAKLPAIIACPIRGKKHPTPSATRALCQGRASYRTRYTFSNQETSFTAEVAVCRVFTTAKRTGRMQRRGSWLMFIVLGQALRALSPRQIRRRYRRRFGIETSYRVAGKVRAWTSSPNAALRFLLLGLSFVMVNVWVHLCWLFTQVPRRGGRWLDVERFRLQRFARFLEHALERTYGYPQAITAPAIPLP
jgi:putative transposase